MSTDNNKSRRSDTRRQKERLEWLPVSSCRLLERNPQYLTAAQMDALKASIERDGFVVPILARPIADGEYEIVSGNHRFPAAQAAGMETVPAVIVELTDAARRRLAVNLNLIHGEPTAEQLAPFLAEMDAGTLRDVHLEGALRDDVLAFDSHLAERIRELDAPDSINRDSSKNRPDCICPTCGRLHQSKSR